MAMSLHLSVSGSGNAEKEDALLQAMQACEADDACFVYRLEDRAASAAALASLPNVAAAVAQLGYKSLEAYQQDAESHIEAVYALSTFCLTPPGDTPKRKGIHDAWNMGCIPVVFDEHSRELPLFLSADESAASTVLMSAEELIDLGDNARSGLTAQLQALAPDLASKWQAVTAQVTKLQFSYSDLGEEDHAVVGPDALDMLLHGLASLASKGTTSAKA